MIVEIIQTTLPSIAVVLIVVFAMSLREVAERLLTDRAVQSAAKMAVFAVEQYLRFNDLTSEEAKRMAVDIMERRLAAIGISVKLEHMADLIEAVLWDEINRHKVPPTGR